MNIVDGMMDGTGPVGCPRRMDGGFYHDGYNPEDDHWGERDGVRHCSYCGSMHPDDFMSVVENGTGELGPTDKNYKVYVDYQNAHLKFYFQHLNSEQKTAFISAYNERPIRKYDDSLDLPLAQVGKKFEVTSTGTSHMIVGYPGFLTKLPFFAVRTDDHREEELRG